MNEISEKLLQKLLAYAQNLETFTKAEVPAYIQELLDFKFMEHLLNYFIPIFILGVILTVIGILVYRFREFFKGDGGFDETRIVTTVGSCIISGVLLLLFIVRISCYDPLLQAYKIKTAPRVYIIDYLKGELK